MYIKLIEVHTGTRYVYIVLSSHNVKSVFTLGFDHNVSESLPLYSLVRGEDSLTSRGRCRLMTDSLSSSEGGKGVKRAQSF